MIRSRRREMGLFDFLFGKKKQDPSFTLGKEEAESICYKDKLFVQDACKNRHFIHLC